ncbi:MAG TPA: hypothetical protein VEF05_17205 [Terriglobales bacterium]|nr:hypothetical protein [Terriglobales bacterium]
MNFSIRVTFANSSRIESFAANIIQYGDVLPLLKDFDDRLAVFGSGDEAPLDFDPSRLPALPNGLDDEHLNYLLEYNTRYISGNEARGYAFDYGH